MQRYVLTGGPGVGKTTVINMLADAGHVVLPEVARKIIEEKGQEFRKNLRQFQQCIVEEQLGLENACTDECAFLDRSIIDGYAYCVVGDVDPPLEIEQYARNRYTKVFLLEPLAEHKADGVRNETPGWQQKIHQALRKAYEHFGYTVIPIHIATPEERVEQIITHTKI